MPGCLKPLRQWWEIRREARRARKKAKKEAKAAERAKSPSDIHVDNLPVSGVMPTHNNFTDGGTVLSYEWAPARTNRLPSRLTPIPGRDQYMASLKEKMRAYDAQVDDTKIADNLKALDARCRRARRVNKMVDLVKSASAAVGSSGMGTHVGGSSSH